MLTKAFSTIVYTISVILLTPFIMFYTKGIADTNYYQPVFAFILCAAEWIYCMGLNYNNVIVGAGHIKQTTKYAITEALINLLGSIVLVHCCGLIGVVIATAAAMFYKMCVNICYMNKNVVKIEKSYTIRSITANSIVFFASFALFKTIFNYQISTISDFLIYACFVGVVVVASPIDQQKTYASSFAWNDPKVAIDWTCGGLIEVSRSIMSEKNRNAPMLDAAEF